MTDPSDFDGLYAIYYQGMAGPGLAQIQLHDGKITGADITGGLWDGEFAVDVADVFISCRVTITLPSGIALATTGEPPKADEARDMHFRLPVDFASKPYVELILPIGRVNVRFQRLR